jgi:hypothetical protein
MYTLKPIFASLFFVFLTLGLFAQTDNKDVNITTSGSGKTLEEAKQAALRSAIEQAFGAFISSKTEMFNDQVVADQMASVSSGNIKSYEMLNESQLPDGSWGVTVKTIVSVDKLTSFVEAKGIAVEIKGGMFALNIKQQILNEVGEVNVITEMVGLIHEIMQTSIDYSLFVGDPKSKDSENTNWEIPLTITATSNQNIDFCANYILTTLQSVALSAVELETYELLEKPKYLISFKYREKTHTFFLRKEYSVKAILTLTFSWDFYLRNFNVNSGIDVFYGLGNRSSYFKLFKEDGCPHEYYECDETPEEYSIYFPVSGQELGTYTHLQKKTLSEIEKMESYNIRSNGIVSFYRNGGYTFDENSSIGRSVAIFDLNASKSSAAAICENLVLNGYTDWRVPNDNEIQLLFRKFKFPYGYGGFSHNYYWSATDADFNVFNFFSGEFRHDLKSEVFVRCVRNY